MEKIIFRAVVLTGACCLSVKHVYVQTGASWGAARSACQDQFTDVSPLTNPLEELVLRWSVGDSKEGWIGIYWNKTIQKWIWSGGDVVSYNNNLSLPSDVLLGLSGATANNVYWTKDRWLWKDGGESHGFFCLSLKVVQEPKTWEGALLHCRKNYDDLDSVTSETENLLATSRIQQTGVTERVWIGLRYLGDGWMWVNGFPLAYTKWNQDQDHQCPVKNRCGALTKEGVWENRDCLEKLSFICY